MCVRTLPGMGGLPVALHAGSAGGRGCLWCRRSASAVAVLGDAIRLPPLLLLLLLLLAAQLCSMAVRLTVCNPSLGGHLMSKLFNALLFRCAGRADSHLCGHRARPARLAVQGGQLGGCIALYYWLKLRGCPPAGRRSADASRTACCVCCLATSLLRCHGQHAIGRLASVLTHCNVSAFTALQVWIFVGLNKADPAAAVTLRQMDRH